MTPLMPEGYLETRRRQIIEAAVSCFSRRGFHQTTMQEICKTAGLSPGAVYNYFRSKEDIISACAEISEKRNENIFVNATAEAGDSISAFDSLIGTFFSLAKQEGIYEAVRFDLEMWAEATRNERIDEILQANKDAIMNHLINEVEKGQDEGLFNNALDSTAIAQVLFSMVLGLEVQIASNPNMDVDAYADVCQSIVWGTLSGGEGSSE
ncbi:MAG: TetR/AcrR family transcriptional regulator [Dehalococcoidales bacterium]|nr:MAG: TetR/AcrR family transcriptional regulator [Dehalococcoidales bacterium]